MSAKVPISIFNEVVLPTLTMETEDVKEAVRTNTPINFPEEINAGTIKLKQGIVHVDLMMKWYVDVMTKQKYGKQQEMLIIVQYSALFIPLRIWQFENAFPIKWTRPAVTGRAICCHCGRI